MSTVFSSSVSETVRDAFNFTVDKFPLSGPDGMRTPWYALFRSDTNQPVGNGSVSSRYEPHTTDDVLALCDAASVAFNGIADVTCDFRDGHYVVINPTEQERVNIFGGVDNVWPRVVIRAPYDGKSFKASIATYRDLCRNLHIMRSTGNTTTISIRHNSGLRKHMNELIDQFNRLKGGWSNLLDTVREMERRRFAMVDFLRAVYGEPKESANSITQHKNRTEAIFKRLQRELDLRGETFGENFTVSGWLAFNAVQGYVQHEARRNGRNKTSNSAGLILSLTDPFVHKAEELVLAA